MDNQIISSIFDAASPHSESMIDKLLSPEGAMLSAGAGILMFTGAKARGFFSTGKKDWLSAYGAWKAGLYGDPKKGIVLGRYRGKLVVYVGPNDVLVIGTKGTGKSVSTFYPTVLSNTRHSMIIFDQSGNMFEKTSGARAKVGQVYQINPDLDDSDCFNLLDMIPNDIGITSSLRALYQPFFDGPAEEKNKTGGDPHWSSEGHKLMVYGTQHVLLGDRPEHKNIPAILHLMSDIKTFLADMVDRARDEECRDVAMTLLGSGVQYCGNVMSSLDKAMSIFRDRSVAAITQYSSFHIEDLATEKDPITIYLTAPTVKVRGMMPFYIGMEHVMKLHLMKTEKHVLSGKARQHPVMVVDDEAENTNRPDINILNVARKFKVTYFFGAQSYNVMKKMYGDKLNLFKTKVMFRSPDGDADMKIISAVSGFYKKKEIRHSSNSGGGKSSTGKSWDWKDTPRLSEYEVGQWGPFGIALLSVFGYKPAVLSMFDSENDREFKKLFVEPYQMGKAYMVRSHWTNSSRPVITTSTQNNAVINVPVNDVEMVEADMEDRNDDEELPEVVVTF